MAGGSAERVSGARKRGSPRPALVPMMEALAGREGQGQSLKPARGGEGRRRELGIFRGTCVQELFNSFSVKLYGMQ